MGQFPPTPFRAFTEDEFYPTASWIRLARVLTGNGGAYGLYGPRGAGKSWLMLRAIAQADKDGGMGLWFPCPSEYDTAAFLSTLSDNLASAVEGRFLRNDAWTLAARRLRLPLALLVAVPVVITLVTSLPHGRGVGSFLDSIPAWLWIWIAAGTSLLIAFAVGGIFWDNRPVGRLVREATALRERIRFTTGLKHGAEFGIKGGAPLAGSFKRTRERSLDERPTTVASLVYDFRNLAGLVAATLGHPLIIGIDELDKIGDPKKTRRLLRDIKGIFELPNVFFLVSVSEEASAALRLGSQRPGGRDEFNSSFYTVLELPPLSPAQVAAALHPRGITIDSAAARMLCLLGTGNWREILRLAEQATTPAMTGVEAGPRAAVSLDSAVGTLLGTLRAEAAALLREVITAYAGAIDADHMISWAWQALPNHAFDSLPALAKLSQSAVQDFWDAPVSRAPSDRWDLVAEPWRRFLLRLFVTERVFGMAGKPVTESVDEAVCDLRDVLTMSARSAAIARLMLQARFGDGLSGAYQPSGQVPLVPGQAF
jgi:hypothetical protein